MKKTCRLLGPKGWFHTCTPLTASKDITAGAVPDQHNSVNRSTSCPLFPGLNAYVQVCYWFIGYTLCPIGNWNSSANSRRTWAWENLIRCVGVEKDHITHPHLYHSSKGILLSNSLTFQIGLLYISWEPDTPSKTSAERKRTLDGKKYSLNSCSSSLKHPASSDFLRLEPILRLLPEVLMGWWDFLSVDGGRVMTRGSKNLSENWSISRYNHTTKNKEKRNSSPKKIKVYLHLLWMTELWTEALFWITASVFIRKKKFVQIWNYF